MLQKKFSLVDKDNKKSRYDKCARLTPSYLCIDFINTLFYVVLKYEKSNK